MFNDNQLIKMINQKYKILFLPFYFFTIIFSQTHIPADPFYLLQYEKSQFKGQFSLQANLFRPLFFNTDSIIFSSTIRSEGYYNDNAPNPPIENDIFE